MTQNYGELTYPEIAGQSEALQGAWEQLGKQQEFITNYLGNKKYEEVVFIGSGTSYYLALSAASTFRKWTGRSASAYPSSEIYLFSEQAVAGNKNKLLVGISRSGESSEVILALDSVKGKPEWTTCGITCDVESTMAKNVPCLVSPLGKEKSTVMTKSFSSMTFMLQVAIAKAGGQQGYVAELQQVMSLSADTVTRGQVEAKNMIDTHSELNKFIYLGMGTYNGLAHEACLKLKEMSCVWTESFGTLEFRHGPKSVIEPGTMVCVLLSESARAFELKVAEEMQAYGAYVVLITAEKGEDTSFADLVFEVGGSSLSDEARAVLYMPLVQYIGYYTALREGRNPDSPRNLTQVVKI
ncbi:SIS domain-containing protein [Paenibacillus pini]|uniref:Glucosamine-6-phosphate deaminase n=1 Tax=Paenibacillus pini JCM 16418 TaxID=1236976 RepID=W7Y610_9BACL|nr:SIS domain-containing protein [Paenibacillus pini]GAF06265.1 glucosamine-6-phosphate deaminase [Paenibacillus pini JCM 16418]